MTERSRRSLAMRLSLGAGIVLVLAVAGTLLLDHFLPGNAIAIGIGASAVALIALAAIVRAMLQPLLSMFHALSGTVLSYKDGDYAFGLHWPRNDEVGDLVEAHNALGQVLRDQRLELVRRELLLDTMVQNTPVAMLLIAEHGAIVFANIAARQLLNRGRKLEGHHLTDVLHEAPSLREALERGGDGLFTAAREASAAGDGEEDDIYHLARRSFTLNGRSHELLLLRLLTSELRRQEVQTWKKVIRVISHELNNSLAPVGSLVNSASELLRRGQGERLPDILATIGERTRHLQSFIEGYAKFAKLPAPRRETVAWPRFVEGLRSQIAFGLAGPLPEERPSFDVAQMEQALFNVLKNAHESGSKPDEVCLAVRRVAGGFVMEVLDRGQGMTETVMSNALVPFYSTKRSGTGLGLALAREIIEAHGGRITISNRDGGGIAVGLVLPS
jgi:nitrogen fixation/metabolism regulation signal transduction histidine kinase